jgi:hypothetical protein
MSKSVTLTYSGSISGVEFSEAGGIFGGFASLDSKTDYAVQQLNYDPTDRELQDGSTVTGYLTVVIKVNSEVGSISADTDALASDIFRLAVGFENNDQTAIRDAIQITEG